jgi:hypothetical protein
MGDFDKNTSSKSKELLNKNEAIKKEIEVKNVQLIPNEYSSTNEQHK